MFLKSTHRKVISYIHLGYRGKRFAIWEIRASGVSTSSITRTLRNLVKLKLVKHHTKPSFKDRNYETTHLWDNDVARNIEVYELAKILNI